MCVDGKSDKPFKTHLGKDTIGNYINNNMIKESKYCSEVMKKHFNKELVMTEEDNKDFENSTKCWICDNYYVDDDVTVRDHCHITGKYWVSAHGDYNISVKLNQKIHVAFHNLKNYDSHLIMQELGEFNLIIKVILNELEKYLSFTINNELSFINSSEFLSSSSDNLIKNLVKNDFKYLIQKFYNDVLDLIKQKGVYPYEYMSGKKN